ncbi:MAG TPA: hypothetical protein VIH82_11555 [Acidimicrobiia bacterium]
MTQTPTTPPSDRDPELAAALEVPPLDAATRHALVRVAVDDDASIDELAPRRVGRLAGTLGLAAALVIGAVVGAVIVTQPDDQGTQTAGQAPTTGATDERAKAGSPAAADQSEAAPQPASGAPPVDLGDLGAVAGDDGVRAAIRARLEAGTSGTLSTIPCVFGSSNAAASIYGLVVISAAGQATVDGQTVAILVGPTPAGDDVAVLLDPGSGCAFIRFVRL